MFRSTEISSNSSVALTDFSVRIGNLDKFFVLSRYHHSNLLDELENPV